MFWMSWVFECSGCFGWFALVLILGVYRNCVQVSCYGAGDERAPVGEPSHQPRFDTWQLEVLEQREPHVVPGRTAIKLTHVKTSSVLQCSHRALPATWGFGHKEVVASGQVTDISGGWMIDDHLPSAGNGGTLPALGNGALASASSAPAAAAVAAATAARAAAHVGDHVGDIVTMPTALAAAQQWLRLFWDKVSELHVRIFSENSKLTGSHNYSSVASDWMWLNRGVLYWKENLPARHPEHTAGLSGASGSNKQTNKRSAAADATGAASTTPKADGGASADSTSSGLDVHARGTGKGSQIYLIGNPVVWWGTGVCMVLTGVVWVGHAARLQRGHACDIAAKQLAVFDRAVFWVCGGWVVHYAPFWLMGRRLFLHHYLPALSFGALAIPLLLEHVLLHLLGRRQLWLVAVAAVAVMTVVGFATFAPLSYGTPLCNTDIDRLTWRKSWDIPRFPDDAMS
jgi:dolichyl-phosphate-mannose--protein O-mannosyl transferase